MKTVGLWIGIAVLASSSIVRAQSAATKEVVVFAAASLKEAFEKIVEDFETAHEGAHVVLQFAGSQELRMQIEHGAAVDVFASADTKHMAALKDGSLAGETMTFAKNELVIVTPSANPARLGKFEDLPKAKKLIVGVDDVPIGRYTTQIFEKAGRDLGDDFRKAIEANTVSRELNVRQILAKVSLGEGDAGVVYRTDAATAGDNVRVIDVPSKWNAIAEYPIAALTNAPHPDLAKTFVAFVLSPAGQKVLADGGFQPAASKK